MSDFKFGLYLVFILNTWSLCDYLLCFSSKLNAAAMTSEFLALASWNICEYMFPVFPISKGHTILNPF